MNDSAINTLLLLNWGLGLEILRAVESNPNVYIAGVITRHEPENPDPWINAVAHYAAKSGIVIWNENTLQWDDIEELIRPMNVQLLLCHAFMRIIPKHIITLPSIGIVNIHPSLLPRYRGPDPTYWVLHQGEPQTGLTSHFVAEKVDGGNIIAQQSIPLYKNDIRESVIERLKTIIPSLIDETFEKLLDPSFQPIAQDESQATYYPRPSNSK